MTKRREETVMNDLKSVDVGVLSLPGTVSIPDSVDDAVPLLEMFQLAGGWATAAFVYAFTEAPGSGGHPDRAKQRSLLTFAEFADKKIRGLSSKNTVQQYHLAWQAAIDKGTAEAVIPGDVDVSLPVEDFAFVKSAHVGENTGEHEWYTPPAYIKATREVLGNIDLDPASSLAANSIVGADTFYDVDTDGLRQDWKGKVWMNPPYEQPLITDFCLKLVASYEDGAVSEAIVLVNNATETSWFQSLAVYAAAVCFPAGRIRFLTPEGVEGAPLQGQGVVYFGENVTGFTSAFAHFGLVVWT